MCCTTKYVARWLPRSISAGRATRIELLLQITESQNFIALNCALDTSYLDLTVPIDSRPFFFNQLRIFDIPNLMTVLQLFMNDKLGGGVVSGNLIASSVLVMILFLSVVAVIATVLVPLKRTIRQCPRPLVIAGTLYFSLIGMGFHARGDCPIAIFQRVSWSPNLLLGSVPVQPNSGLRRRQPDIRIGQTGLQSETAGMGHYRSDLPRSHGEGSPGGIPVYHGSGTTGAHRDFACGAIMPLGFLLDFAFPTGMRLVETVDREPTPWFWGINGATGVVASVLGVMLSMALGINVTMLISAICYLLWSQPASPC